MEGLGVLAHTDAHLEYIPLNKLESVIGKYTGNIISAIDKNQIDVLMNGGDNSGPYIRYFRVAYEYAKNKEIKVVEIIGNHDRKYRGRIGRNTIALTDDQLSQYGYVGDEYYIQDGEIGILMTHERPGYNSQRRYSKGVDKLFCIYGHHHPKKPYVKRNGDTIEICIPPMTELKGRDVIPRGSIYHLYLSNDMYTITEYTDRGSRRTWESYL